MATIVAAQTGNWSDGATWVGGTKPGASDTAQTDAYDVTIDEDVICTRLEATSTGSFLVTAAPRSITAAIQGSGTNTCVKMTHAANTVTINGNIGANAGGVTLHITGNGGTTTIIGDVSGGLATNIHVISKALAGTVNVIGNITGGSTASSYSLYNTGAVVNVTGNVTGGIGSAIYHNTTQQLSVTGDVTTSSTSYDGDGIYNASTGTVAITGNVTGNSQKNSGAFGIDNHSTGTVTVSGTATGGAYSPAIRNFVGGTVNVNRTVGCATSANPGIEGTSATGTTTFKEAEYGTTGSPPTWGYCKLLVDQDVNQIICINSADNTDYALSNDYPAIADVETGVVYKLGTLTGTLAGGGGLTAQQVRDAMKLAPSAGAAAAGSVDALLADIVLDTGTSLPAEFAALASDADIATAVRTELATELAHIDTDLSDLATATSIAALNDITVADIIAGITEGTLDLQEILRIMLAALAGKASGGGTATIKFRDQADTKDRITATVDVDGNRTLVVVDGS